MCQCVRLLGKWFKDVCVWYSNTALSLSTHGSRKLGQCARLINCLSTRSAIVFFPFHLLVVLLVYVMFYSDRCLGILACQNKTSKFLWCSIKRFYFWKTHWFWFLKCIKQTTYFDGFSRETATSQLKTMKLNVFFHLYFINVISCHRKYGRWEH